MAANPLDPTKPTLLDQSIELTGELRAIKSRLVADKAAIENLNSSIINIGTITPYGLTVLQSADADVNHQVLGAGTSGQQIYQTEFMDDIVALLGLQTSISVGINKVGVTLPAGIKINTMQGSRAKNENVTWQVPFTSTIWAGVITMNEVNEKILYLRNLSNTGATVDFEGFGTVDCSIIAIGI